MVLPCAFCSDDGVLTREVCSGCGVLTLWSVPRLGVLTLWRAPIMWCSHTVKCAQVVVFSLCEVYSGGSVLTLRCLLKWWCSHYVKCAKVAVLLACKVCSGDGAFTLWSVLRLWCSHPVKYPQVVFSPFEDLVCSGNDVPPCEVCTDCVVTLWSVFTHCNVLRCMAVFSPCEVCSDCCVLTLPIVLTRCDVLRW